VQRNAEDFSEILEDADGEVRQAALNSREGHFVDVHQLGELELRPASLAASFRDITPNSLEHRAAGLMGSMCARHQPRISVTRGDNEGYTNRLRAFRGFSRPQADRYGVLDNPWRPLRAREGQSRSCTLRVSATTVEGAESATAFQGLRATSRTRRAGCCQGIEIRTGHARSVMLRCLRAL
jgi:hypothetical protein